MRSPTNADLTKGATFQFQSRARAASQLAGEWMEKVCDRCNTFKTVSNLAVETWLLARFNPTGDMHHHSSTDLHVYNASGALLAVCYSAVPNNCNAAPFATDKDNLRV